MDKFTEEYIENIRNIIAENNSEQAQEILKDLHPAVIAELYQNLDLEEAEFLYKLLDKETAADVLMELIAQLPPGFRTVFNMFAIEGYSHREIAETLNINESTSRSQYTRAKRLLQIWIKEYK